MEVCGSLDRITGSFCDSDLTVGEVLGDMLELTDLDVRMMRRANDSSDDGDDDIIETEPDLEEVYV